MLTPDLHPEELLDRAANGTLTEEERTRLETHLASCVTCRLEQRARADFQAIPVPGMHLETLVTRALAGAPVTERKAAPRRRRAPFRFVAIAAALVGAASFGALGLAKPLGVLLGIVHVEPQPAQPEPASAKNGPRPKRVERPPAPEPPSEPLVDEPPVAHAVVVPAPAQGQSPAPPPAHRATIPSGVSPPTPAIAEAPTAGSMFAEATARRSQSDLRTAEALYRELTRRFPESDEALLSHGILGRLFFDTERYLEALKEFEAVVGGRHQDLAEDALAHQAMTLEALHRTTEARETWERLLQRFPASLYSRRANERLRSLPTP